VTTASNQICDFREGCAIIHKAFGAGATSALHIICGTPHLAEALFAAGVTGRREAIDMARAIQEARRCPFERCGCLLQPPIAA
jgi:hypothetical protein